MTDARSRSVPKPKAKRPRWQLTCSFMTMLDLRSIRRAASKLPVVLLRRSLNSSVGVL